MSSHRGRRAIAIGLGAGLALAALAAQVGGPSAQAAPKAAAAGKLRVVMSTDFPPLDVCSSGCAADRTSDPDDVQSMVRFLLYTNEFDVEGLIASAGTFANVARKQNVLDALSKYDQVDENLRKHDGRFPTAGALKAVTFQGRNGTWGKSAANNVGAGKDSEASNALISIVDKPDPRPVYVGIWGDASNVAQAIWKVQNTRSPAQLNQFLSKLRIYQIARQDGSIDWLMNSFPNLRIVYAANTWTGFFGGGSLGNRAWINANIRNKGPLGAIYPLSAMGVDGVKEGDSPSFMYLVSAAKGKNNPEDPTQPSWGGQFRKKGSTNQYIDGPGPSSISRWRSEYQADFAMRAGWMTR